MVHSTGQSRMAIFLGGSGRSGTTMMLNLLGSHAAIAKIPYESKLIGWPDYLSFPQKIHETQMSQRPDLIEWFKTRWLGPYFKGKAAFKTAPDDAFQGYRGLFQWLSREELEPKLDSLDHLVFCKDLKSAQQAYGRFLDGVFGVVAQREGESLWVEKTPGTEHYADLLAKWFVNFRFINVIRDGRDVACSLQGVPWGTKDPLAALDWWAATTTKGLKVMSRLSPDQGITLKYETVVQSPDQAKAYILKFLGLGGEASDLPYEMKASSVGRWRNTLSPEIQSQIWDKHGKLLHDLGYTRQ